MNTNTTFLPKSKWISIPFSLIATFYATTVTKENRITQSGLDVVEILKNKLRKNAGVVDFKVLQLDTVSKCTF